MDGPPTAARAAGTGLPGTVRLLVDGHVHFHPSFDREVALDRAAENFEAAAVTCGVEPTRCGVLMLTESAGTDAFGGMTSAARSSVGKWSFEPAADGCSLYARSSRSELLLVSGRQVATTEGLEVLALGTRGRFEDGMSLETTVEEVRAAGAIPVIPWGFGKWWFTRGRQLRDLLERSRAGRLLLGDNGGRPRVATEPPLFQVARARGVAVLAGSDPLPFPEQVNRVGSYGSVLELKLDPERPAERLRDHLSGLRTHPPAFGRRAALTRFVSSQLRMQMWKRGLSA